MSRSTLSSVTRTIHDDAALIPPARACDEAATSTSTSTSAVMATLAAAFVVFALTLALAPAARAADSDRAADNWSNDGRLPRPSHMQPENQNDPAWVPLEPQRDADEGNGVIYLPLPTIGANGIEVADTPQKTAGVLQIMILLTVLALAPSILILLTSFLRIVIVMGFIRKALSTQTLPPDQVLVGLSLLLTFFVMWPTWQKSWAEGWMPYWNGDAVEVEVGVVRRMTQAEAFERILAPQRAFMFSCLEGNEGREELFFFLGMYTGDRVTPEQAATMRYGDVPTVALVPAFVTAELRRAFWMGFLLYLPFLILDMVIASVLMSMGMMMLQPAMISLPFKLVLFVMIDGWKLLMEGLVSSFPPEIYENALMVSG